MNPTPPQQFAGVSINEFLLLKKKKKTDRPNVCRIVL